jgi:3-phenylpropionate/cinnamic acid dioxygenase small subunit
MFTVQLQAAVREFIKQHAHLVDTADWEAYEVARNEVLAMCSLSTDEDTQSDFDYYLEQVVRENCVV